MILVLVFLLFCTFIGGSVLAVASANGARARHLSEEEQQFLNQRSAVSLMQDALTKEYTVKDGTETKKITPPQPILSIDVITTTKQPVKITQGGGVVNDGAPTKSITFVCKAEKSDYAKPALQRLVYESAVLRVLDMYNYSATNGDSVKLENLVFMPLSGSVSVTLTDIDQFWLKDTNIGNLTITLNEGENGEGAQLGDPVQAHVLCSAGDDPYHFYITFGEDGKEAQASLKMNAMVSERPGQDSSDSFEPRSDSDTSLQYKVTNTTSTVVISWQSPEIVKGGID